jgi:hypothetical protein
MTISEMTVIEADTAESATLSLVKLAISKDADIDKLERLMEMHMINEEREARKAYHRAMSRFKANPPKIINDKKVAYNGVSYTHSSLSNVTDSINMELTKHGLSATWSIDQTNTPLVTVICTLTHELGHSEQALMTAPPDSSGKKNTIQEIASTVKYLQRYTVLAITGLATEDPTDNDGRGDTTRKARLIDENQQADLLSSLQEKGIHVEAVYKEFGVKDLSQLSIPQFKTCLMKIQNT